MASVPELLPVLCFCARVRHRHVQRVWKWVGDLLPETAKPGLVLSDAGYAWVREEFECRESTVALQDGVRRTGLLEYQEIVDRAQSVGGDVLRKSDDLRAVLV